MQNAPGERDREAGTGAPYVAMCSPAGSLDVRNTGISEYILAVTAEQAGLMSDSTDIPAAPLICA